jgi:hypothetical protein
MSPKLKNSEIDSAVIRAQADLSLSQGRQLNKISDKTWFRQYAKQSKENLKKILKKVKKGLKHGDYTYASKPEFDERGFIEPKVKKGKKVKKAQKKEVVPKKQEKKQKLTRKEREQVKRTVRRAPSGRVYSPTEIREGVGSKRAQEWRAKNKIDVKDFSKVR